MVAVFLETLAAELEQSWRRLEYDERRFPDVARDTLARANPSATLDAAALLSFVAKPQAAARAQHDAEQVLPLYRGHRFDIHAHFWLDAIAPPHDHGWAGAFHIVEGRSLNSYHGFTRTERVSAAMQLGQLCTHELVVHGAGDTIAVRPGPAFIHGVHYLDRPGVALSVRTRVRERQSMTYFHGGLALGDRGIDDELRCRVRALAIARALDEDSFVAMLDQLVRGGDRVASFVALSNATQAGWAMPQQILDAGQQTHGEGFAALVRALEDLGRYQDVVQMRGETRDPALLGFLAALYTSGDRRELLNTLDLLGLLEQHDPATETKTDPWRRVGEWLVALLVDDDAGAVEIPTSLAGALGQLAAGESLASVQSRLGEGPDPLTEHELEFVGSVSLALAGTPLYRCLC